MRYIECDVVLQQNIMQVVTDPDNYEASQIVQKSSSSGLFSNNRLLVIKNGFLYYFTNVPKNYKTHVPNILNTLKQLPKSSIEIKAINQIKMQSSNSTNLIIKFYEKDMIEREDIRKSISDQNFKYAKKNTQELKQWKFTYSKVLNCRLWYTALLKLKAYFSKQQAKIQEFFNNFDPVKRNSLMPTLSKDPSSGSLKNYRASQMVSQFKRQDQNSDLKKQVEPPITLQPNSPKKVSNQSPPAKQQIPFLIQNNSDHKLETINEDDEIINKKIEDQYRQQIQQQIRLEEKKKNEKIILGIKSQLNAKNEKIRILEEAIKATDKLRAKEQEAREKERQKQREKQLQIQRQLQKQRQRLKLKEEMQKNRQRQRQNNQAMRQREQQREMQSDVIITPLSLETEGDHHRKTIQLNQFSVQTDGQQQQQSYMDRGTRKRYNESYVSGLASTQRDTYNIFRNAGSISFELQPKDRSYENYDYYLQIEGIYSSEIKFEQKIKRQIRLINYVNKIKDVALDTLTAYIDENRPTKSISFIGSLFETQIICEHGKIININGQQKLVYNNKQHQRLKREFKLYNYLQDKLLCLYQKRKKVPLRVPLCYFFEYHGYSALLKYMPYIKQIEEKVWQQKVYKLAQKIIQQENMDHFNFYLIANREINLYMITVKNVYKVTKEHQLQQFQFNDNSVYGPKFLGEAAFKFLSVGAEEICKQIQRFQKLGDVQSMKKVMVLKQVMLCRALKKLYRSTEPFSYDSNGHTNADFFTGVLSSKQEICSLVSDDVNVVFNGLFVSYFMHMFGMETPAEFEIYESKLEQTEFSYKPISRSFYLSPLYPKKLQKNLQSYIKTQKLDLAQTTFSILQQVQHVQQSSLKLLKIKYKLKLSTQLDISTILDMINTLKQIRASTNRHHCNWIETYLTQIQCQTLGHLYPDCLETIYQAIRYIGYMFGDGYVDGGLEDWLCLLVAETLAKMNDYQDSMNVYRKMLGNSRCTLSQEEISLSIANVFYHFGQVDPFTLIQFLLTLVPSEISSESPTPTSTQSRLYQQIGHLYNTVHNWDLSIKYLEKSFQYYEKSGVKSQEQVNNVIEICLSLYNTYRCTPDKSIIFAKLILMVELNSQNQKFVVHIVRMARAFVTACFCEEIRPIGRDRRARLSEVLEQLRDGEGIVPQFVHPISHEDLLRSINKLEQRGQLGQKQARVIELLDLSEIQTFILTCQ